MDLLHPGNVHRVIGANVPGRSELAGAVPRFFFPGMIYRSRLISATCKEQQEWCVNVIRGTVGGRSFQPGSMRMMSEATLMGHHLEQGTSEMGKNAAGGVAEPYKSSSLGAVK